MQFVCFLFNFGPNSLKLLGLIIEASFMGCLVTVCFVITNWGAAVEINFPVGVVQGGWDWIL